MIPPACMHPCNRRYALAIGNYLNGGTNKGAAWGFKVDSLNKLIGTKTLDNKSTLLHYMARKVCRWPSPHLLWRWAAWCCARLAVS